MKGNPSSNEQDEGKRADSVERTNVDNLSAKVDQNSTGEEQTVTTEEKLPDEPLTDQERQLLYEKGIK